MATCSWARKLAVLFFSAGTSRFGTYARTKFLPTSASKSGLKFAVKSAPFAENMMTEAVGNELLPESVEKPSPEQTQSHERDDSLSLAHPTVPATEEGGMSDSAEMESGGGVGGCGQSGSDEGDKYLYLRRGFTSEIFKIEIQNIPKYIGYTELKKKLERLGLKPVKIKKPQRFQRLPHCFVTFRSEEDREVALKALEGQVWKNRPITAKMAAPSVDPLYRQRVRSKREGSGLSGDENTAKKLRLEKQETLLTLNERLDRVVTPLLGTSYESQLATKTAQMRLALQKAAYLIQKEDSNPGEEFAKKVELNGGMMCELKPILRSPLQTGYRNKAEMSVGINPDGTAVVGFRLGSYEDGDFTVVPPDNCVHIPDSMKILSKSFEEFFKLSPLSPYIASSESGYWRQVTLRCYSTGESMAVVVIHPQSLTKEELEREKQRLVEFFTSGLGAQNAPTSLYFHTFARKTKEHTQDIHHLLGEKHVHEDILGLQFRISPDAFFQTNSPATEVLYQQILIVIKYLHTPGRLCVWDNICCGTGTIGLYLAKVLSARRVVGVEMNEQAVEDARANAELNGMAHAQFVCGRAEDILQKQLEEEEGVEGEGGMGSGDVIGIVDPPRAGLHPRVVQCIRRHAEIQKLVYVSCNPEGHKTLGNFVDLCRRPSLRVKGTPFSPVVAVPVDLFPHTPHCELVVLFQRVTTPPGTSQSMTTPPGTPKCVTTPPGTSQSMTAPPGTSQSMTTLPGTSQSMTAPPGTS